MIITKSSYVTGPQLRRVTPLFTEHGYPAPRPDAPGTGAYAMNIIDQYPNLEENEVLSMLEGWYELDEEINNG